MARGDPREDYARVVHVIPMDTPVEDAAAIFATAWQDGRQTVTGSYDDAGVGNLSDRTAILWNIDREVQPEYREFYEQFYPGVKVVFFRTTLSFVDPATRGEG